MLFAVSLFLSLSLSLSIALSLSLMAQYGFAEGGKRAAEFEALRVDKVR